MPSRFATRPDSITEQYFREDSNSIQPLDNKDLKEIGKIHEMLTPGENVIVVARQPRMLPGGSYIMPNIIYATNMRIIIGDPHMSNFKDNIVEIPYDDITSVKLEKALFSSSAIKFEAPALVNSKSLGMIHGIVGGENHYEKILDAIPTAKAEDLMEVIHSGMQPRNRK